MMCKLNHQKRIPWGHIRFIFAAFHSKKLLDLDTNISYVCDGLT